MTSTLLGDLWATPAAVWGIGLAAAALVLLWNWRIFLPGLALLQFAAGELLAYRYGVPARWLAIYFGVVAISALILALSPLQLQNYRQADHSGNPFFRGLLLALLGVIVLSVEFNGPLPVVDVPTARLGLWLVVCSFLTLALTDDPLLAGSGLLLWFIPVHSLLAVILPLPALVALLGSLELLVALSCSYLVLAGSEQIAGLQQPLTDTAFPARPFPAPRSRRIASVRRFLLRRLAAIGSVLYRSAF